MDSKKISFGFSKITKKTALLPTKPVNRSETQIELIKCLEGQQIKLIEERKEEAPIVIPLKENGKTSAALASLMRRRAVLLGEEGTPELNEPSNLLNNNFNVNENCNDDTSENLDKRAEREILADLKSSKDEPAVSSLVLQTLKPDELPLDGAKESTLNDYEDIPIEQYGLAMLRGMGWQPPVGKQKAPVDEAPTVRPKGMGLGADKALKNKPLLVAPEANEILEIKKLAYVQILGGKHKDAYGQIEGFDDDRGRIIVKLAIGGLKETFNEFLCQPVSKKQYTQYGKCINSVKYDQYKKLENEHGQIIIKKEEDYTNKSDHQIEKNQEDFVKFEIGIKKSSQHKYDESRTKNMYIEKHEKLHVGVASASSSVKRDRRHTRSRSSSTPRKGKTSSKRRSRRDSSSSSDTNLACESDKDSYEKHHKHHKKSKSHKHSSRSSKKKNRHYNSSDENEDRHKHKKNKKTTKKSKKQRSRTPSRHRK